MFSDSLIRAFSNFVELEASHALHHRFSSSFHFLTFSFFFTCKNARSSNLQVHGNANA